MAHTPGPWTIYLSSQADERHANDVAYIEASPSDENRGEIAVIYSDENQVPNARLISAAPELLKALRQVLDGTEGIPLDYRDEAEAAITKAGGRE